MAEGKSELITEAIKLSGTAVLAAVRPALVLPWEASFLLYGYFVERRRNKAIEWINMFRDNSQFFSEEVVGDPDFQDAFVNCFEKYLRERNEEKRRLMQGVFLGFSKTARKDDFPLERFYAVIESISPVAMQTLGRVELVSRHSASFFQVFEGKANFVSFSVESIYELVALNILVIDPTPRAGPLFEPFVKFTNFGYLFVDFLRGNDKRT